MRNITLSAFADECSKTFAVQLKALNDMGIRYIDVRGVNEKNIVEYTLEEAKEIKKQVDSAGIKVSSIGSPIAKMDLDAPFEQQLNILKHTLDIAEILETSYIRIFSFYLPKEGDPAQYRDEVIRRLRILTQNAAERDVVLLLENEEGLFGQFIDTCLDIMQGVNHPNLRMVLDTANFIVAGERNFPYAIDKLWPYIESVHIKDACLGAAKGTNVLPGDGDGQIKEVLDALVRANYHGIVSLEPHLTKFDNRQRHARNSNFTPSSDEEGIEKFTLALDAVRKILKELNIKDL